MVEWVFSLFSSMIPLEIQFNFYFGFFAEGWTFFYKMCISVILNTLKHQNKYSDPEDLYIDMKLGKHNDNQSLYLKRWQEILDYAYEIDFNN
jgi:hypothetical protein